MELAITRKDFTARSTIGDFLVDGVFSYYSLELPWADGANVHQVNAILPGHYEVIIDFSNRFQRNMPHILNVPGRDSIRIHIANFPKDIEGCVGIGKTKGEDFIGQSKVAFNDFFPKLENALKEGKVFITIA